MASRIERAQQIWLLHPNWGRREVNTVLRREFGQGLRWSVLGKISLDMNRPVSLRAQTVVAGFSPSEREVLKRFIDKGAWSYIRAAVAHRYQLRRQARAKRLTLQQYWAKVRKDYREHGWIVGRGATKRKERIGTPDIFAMLRYFRDKTLPDDYIGKPHHKPYSMLNKAIVLAQKAKYRAKKGIIEGVASLTGKTSSGDKRDWITQLDKRIAIETDPTRLMQLKAQKARLEGLA